MRTRTLIAIATVMAAVLPAAAAAQTDTPPPPPANDAFESAAPIASTVSGTLIGATLQPGEPGHGFGSVWYVFRPAADGRFAAALTETTNSALIAIYRGESLASVQQLGATDNNGPPRVAFDGAAGVAYRLAVTAPYQDDDARFRLRVAPAPLPSNDDFTGALPVDAPGRYTGSVADATRELGEPHHAGATAHHSLWYRFRARRTGRLSIQAVSKACGMIVAVYTGTDLSSLHSVGGRMGDTFRFRARRGRVYRIAVDCRYASLGDFELTISDGSIEGKGVSVAPVAGQTVESVLERGLRTVVTARRKVKVGIELRVSPATARRLDLSDSVIGRTSGSLTYNQSLHATLRLTSEAKKALAGAEKLSAVLRLRLLGTDAPNRVLNVPVEIPN